MQIDPSKTPRKQAESEVTNYSSARFGSREDMGIGRYRNNDVCYGEAPANLVDFLWCRNGCDSEPSSQDFRINIGAMQIFAFGNPTYLRFKARGGESHTQLSIMCKDKPAAQATLYQDTHRQIAKVSLQRIEGDSRLDIGVISCLAVARASSILWGETSLNSAPMSCAWTNKVWEFLVEKRLALVKSDGQYVLKSEIGRSSEAAGVLRCMLQMERDREYFAAFSLSDAEPMSPRQLSRLTPNGYRTIDFWFQSLNRETI